MKRFLFPLAALITGVAVSTPALADLKLATAKPQLTIQWSRRKPSLERIGRGERVAIAADKFRAGPDRADAIELFGQPPARGVLVVVGFGKHRFHDLDLIPGGAQRV